MKQRDKGIVIVILLIIAAYLAYYYRENDSVQDCTSSANDNYVLQESELYCPFCGDKNIAVNNEIVCRNESCGKYGLPIMVYDRSIKLQYE